ncbi:hypothetical protein ACFL6S_26690 [Candidatus Poribacteria bacterium]
MSKLIAVLLAVLFAFFGCMRRPGLTIEALKNGQYRVENFEGIIQLRDGRYEGEPYVEGAASRPVFILSDLSALGDLNGDGVEDAAAILVGNFGGSGTFYYLRAVINQMGKPMDVAGALLGDRIRLESIRISEGMITIGMVEHGQGDPMTSPSAAAVVVYRLQGKQLIQESRNSY